MKTASFWKVEEALTEERTLDGVREVTYIPYDGFSLVVIFPTNVYGAMLTKQNLGLLTVRNSCM